MSGPILSADENGRQLIACAVCRSPLIPLHRREANQIQWQERTIWSCGQRCAPAIDDRTFRRLVWRLKYATDESNA